MRKQTSAGPASRKMVRTSVPGVYARGGSYCVVYRDPAGKKRKRHARTLAEARELKAKLVADVARGEYRETSKVTFAEYAEGWLGSYVGRTSRGIRPETVADYRKRIEADAIPFFGRMRLSAIEPRDVKAFAARVASRGVSPNTVRLAVCPVRALLATAFEDGLIRANPAAGVRIAQRVADSADEERAKAMTEDELRLLLGKLPAEWRLFFEFLAHTGLRVGEAIALSWDCVDLGKRRVLVRRRFYRGSFAPPKTRYGRRDVPLSAGLARALWALWAERRPADGDLVFVSEKGGMIEQSNLTSRVLKPAARAAGVEWVSYHSFRHSCASILFRRGLNAKQVQAWLGHHSPAFTLATYIHLVSDDLPGADFLDDVTGAPGEAERGLVADLPGGPTGAVEAAVGGTRVGPG